MMRLGTPAVLPGLAVLVAAAVSASHRGAGYEAGRLEWDTNKRMGAFASGGEADPDGFPALHRGRSDAMHSRRTVRDQCSLEERQVTLSASTS